MIIGVTGTDGAGKGAVAEYLVAQKGYTHISARELIVEGIERRGLSVSRENMRIVANEMRQNNGNDVIVVRAFEKIEENAIARAVIESVRTTAEVITLKADGGILLAVDADQKLRYERIIARKSASDSVTFEKFQEQEAIEMNDPDPNGMQKAKVMEMADYTIMNEGTLEDLHQQIEAVLAKLQHKSHK